MILKYKAASTATLLGCMLAMAGCADRQFAVSANDPLSSAATITGQAFGGHQPIGNATVQLYSVGTTGYGSAGDLYATTTTSIDGNATFSFTQTNPGIPPTGPIAPLTPVYACPASNPQMYIVIRGGNTLGGTRTDVNNTAAVSAVAIGPCNSAASLFINLNEVTTVGTMAALQQYFNPVTETFGYPNTPQAIQGFANGVATIGNLVNIAAGTAVTSITVSAVPAGATNSVSVTITPETKKINLIANIMAQCVNTTSNMSTACATLFGAVMPPTAAFTSQPAADYSSITASNEDVLQALYFMLTNPSSGGAANMTTLFNSTVPDVPFAPYYATAPTDWTIAINYTSSSTCTNAAGNTATSKFLNGVNNPVIDAAGNVWASNISASGNLFEISPTGIPMTCGLGTLADTGGPATIDTNGYVWVGSQVASGSPSSYHLYKWNPNSGSLDSTWPAVGTPLALAADANGNILYTSSTSTSTFSITAGSVNEFAGAAAAGASPGSITTQKIATVYSDPIWMAVDSLDRIWVAISHTGTPTSEALFDIYPSNNTSGSSYMTGISDGAHTGFESANVADSNTYSPYGIAVGATTVDSANGAGSGSSGTSYEWEFFTPSTTPGTATATHTGRSIGGLVSPRGIAVDGASNVWGTSNTATTSNYVTGTADSGSNIYCLAEISSTGMAISATSTSGYGLNSGGYQKDPTMLTGSPRGIAIDPTGNVWVGINSTTATSIVELVGTAVPAVTPLSVAAATGKLGQMP